MTKFAEVHRGGFWGVRIAADAFFDVSRKKTEKITAGKVYFLIIECYNAKGME